MPLIRQLRDQGEAARRHELERALRHLQRGDDPKAVLEALSQGLTNKLLHAPSAALRQAALDGDLDLLRAAERLYDDRDDAQPAP